MSIGQRLMFVADVMGMIGILALAANLGSVLLLLPYMLISTEI